jgi:hypothetical protein
MCHWNLASLPRGCTEKFILLLCRHTNKMKYLKLGDCGCTELIHWMQGHQHCIQQGHYVYVPLTLSISLRHTNKMNLIHKKMNNKISHTKWLQMHRPDGTDAGTSNIVHKNIVCVSFWSNHTKQS